jgi:hypothetical protein
MSKFRLVPTMTAAAFALMVGSLAHGQETKGQQKCINTLNKDTAKVAATQGKNDSACVKSATKGSASATCVPNDGSGKVAPVESKAASDETNNGCLSAPNQPDFGYGGVNAGTVAAVAAEINLFADTYGSTDTTGVISTAKADGKCQAAVSKDLEKIMATKWKVYLGCKKTALATATDKAPLEACVNSLGGDPKVGAAESKLVGDAGKDCSPVSLSADFPGKCSGPSPLVLAICLSTRVECRICQALNQIDNLTVNCDLMDDGMANGSCP